MTSNPAWETWDTLCPWWEEEEEAQQGQEDPMVASNNQACNNQACNNRVCSNQACNNRYAAAGCEKFWGCETTTWWWLATAKDMPRPGRQPGTPEPGMPQEGTHEEPGEEIQPEPADPDKDTSVAPEPDSGPTTK